MTAPPAALTAVVVLLLLALASGPTGAAEPGQAQGLVFDAAPIGQPGSNAPAELFLPAGSGPFPAMVLLPGRNGVARHYRE